MGNRDCGFPYFIRVGGTWGKNNMVEGAGCMNPLDKIIQDINKEYKMELIKKGTEQVYVKKIPFSSPRANYMTYGGVPIGKATEFLGPEGGGKTTSAIDIVGQAQKMAKEEYEAKLEKFEAEIAELETKEAKWAKDELKALKPKRDELIERGPKQIVYIDAENTFDEDWARLNGVDTDDIYLIRPQDHTAEQVLQMSLDLIKSDQVLLMVLDSLPMLVSKALYEEDLEKRTYGGIAGVVTEWTRKVSPLLSKHQTAFIVINQVREDFDNPYNQFNTPGGRALKHLYALRLFFRKGSFIDEDNNELPQRAENPYGNLVDVQVVKTKVCKPDRRVGYYTLNYYEGIDVLSDTIDIAVKYGFMAKAGSWYRLIDPETGEILTEPAAEEGDEPIELKFQGKPKLLDYLKNHADLFQELWEAVHEKVTAV